MRNSLAEIAFASHSLVVSPSFFSPTNSLLQNQKRKYDTHHDVFHRETRSWKLFSEKTNNNSVEKESIEIVVKNGPFTKELFTNSDCWGVRPLLIRNAFDRTNDNDYDFWPSWEEVAMLSCDEDAESRLITHQPGIQTSWDLQLGPFEEEDVQSFVIDDDSKEDSNKEQEEIMNQKWTLVVNDVDRFSPSLSDWIHDQFHFIPRWRMDDGQISLARDGGGIGPHVDNYDVFLIQMEGVREWQIGKYICSLEQEREESVPGIDVRILSQWDSDDDSMVEIFQLEPGDMLYLPPRIPHCGTAIGNHQCMTLSVGLRAPSASDMISKIAEQISDSIHGNAAKRYQDTDLFKENHDDDNNIVDNEITDSVREKAKKLIQDAIDEILQNNDMFDPFLGSILTESKRDRINYPEPLIHDDDEWLDSLGVWGNPQLAVQSIMKDHGALYAAEGLAWAYSTTNNGGVHRLFANGHVWELPNSPSSIHFIKTIANHRRITRNELLFDQTHVFTNDEIHLLEDLISKGYLYGENE